MLFSSLWPRCGLHRGLIPAAGLALMFATGCQAPWKKPDLQANYEKQMAAATAPLVNFDPKKMDKRQQADLKFAGGRAAESSGDLAGAMGAYKEAAKLDPKRYDFHLRMGVVYDKMGQFGQSPACYSKALELSPGNPDVFADMGYSLYMQGRYPEAEMALRQAVKVRPDHSRAHNNLAMCLVHTNKIEEALQEFHRGGAEPANAHTNVAFALATDGRFEESRKHYKLALAHNPGMEKATEGLSEIERLEEKAGRLEAVASEFGDESANPFIALKHAEARMAARQEAQPVVPTAPRAAQAPTMNKTAATSATPAIAQSAAPQPAAVQAKPAADTKAWSLDDASAANVAEKVAEKPAEKPATPTGVQNAGLVQKLPATGAAPTAAKQASATRTAPKLSFSPGALHRDRYLEEQSDPAMQQAGFSQVEAP